MKITEAKIKVRDLCEGYIDLKDDGVFTYYNADHKLTVRPMYQREFVYNDQQRRAVINSVYNGFPLNTMYWSKVSDSEYEVIDGQQRTISIGQYLENMYPIKIDGHEKYMRNLTETEQQRILDYEVTVYICEGTTEERLAWFKIINIAGVPLTNQELLNATYAGTFISDAKRYFSKRGCAAAQMSDGYVKANSIRQEYLEKALTWIAERDGITLEQYMALHQHDVDANELWLYFQEVISWAKRMFPDVPKKLTENQDWGTLYNKYHGHVYNTNELRETINKLVMDEDVTKQTGIIPYILSERTTHDEKYLSIRTFPEQMKRRMYERQGHKCAICGGEFTFEDMQGDHVVPWSKGGRTVEENCQMLCSRCNNDKRDR